MYLWSAPKYIIKHYAGDLRLEPVRDMQMMSHNVVHVYTHK